MIITVSLSLMCLVFGVVIGRGYSSGCLTESIKQLKRVQKYLQLLRYDEDETLTNYEKEQMIELSKICKFIVDYEKSRR